MIGPAIKWHLDRNGITQYRLADRMCVGRSVVTKWCSDESNPTWATLNKIAKWLNISVLDIVDRAAKIKAGQDEPK